MPKLTANTLVRHPGGEIVLLAADGDLPDWADGLVGDHLLDGPRAQPAAAPQPPADTKPPIPARSGPGSGAEKWRAYAADQQVEVPADASREDVIEALDAAGKPTK
jgi:hypothetical protein